MRPQRLVRMDETPSKNQVMGQTCYAPFTVDAQRLGWNRIQSKNVFFSPLFKASGLQFREVPPVESIEVYQICIYRSMHTVCHNHNIDLESSTGNLPALRAEDS